jgi:hypothetical protein
LFTTTTNTAIVSCEDPSANEVTDTDEYMVFVISPQVTIDKVADQNLVNPGTEVTYTIEITNTGDTLLADCVLDDATLGILISVGVLNPGDTIIVEETAIINEDTVNTATVACKDQMDNTHQDDASVVVIADNDFDDDGILNNVDVEPNNPSNDASDDSSPIPTTLSIVSSGDQILTIIDDPDPTEGLQIIADPSGGPTPAQISTCGGASSIEVSADVVITLTCGSVSIKIISGVDVIVQFIADDETLATASLSEGNDITFDDATLSIESNAGTAVVTITADDGTTAEVSLAEGNAITVDSVTSIITADPDNPTDVTVVIDGEEIVIPPGGSGVVDPTQAIQNLIDAVLEMELSHGTENSLTSNLDVAIEKLADDNSKNDSAACGNLSSFEDKVDEQDGENLTAEQADLLRSLATDIEPAIGCI